MEPSVLSAESGQATPRGKLRERVRSPVHRPEFWSH